MSEQDTPNRAMRFLDIFEQGRRFTEEILKENEKLRMLVASLRAEKAAVDVSRLQERLRIADEEIAELRRANQELRDQFSTVEDESREFAERYVKVERQYSDVIHLYVASHQLHSTLKYDDVLKNLKDIVINVIGAEVFGIYAVNDDTRHLGLVAHEGLDGAPAMIPIGAGAVGEAARTGTRLVRDPSGDLPAGEPAAVLPLRAGDSIVGVIAIHKLLSQKESFEDLDYDLFELLGSHAGTALCAATLYALSERKRLTLEGLVGIVCKR